MSKLYIFGIGGTGSRVIKSLTMLLAAGVEIPNTTEIVPIIIDPDRTNGDLQRTMDILRRYQTIRASIAHEKNNFFRTKITLLQNSGAQAANTQQNFANEFGFSLSGVEGKSFREFIDFKNLSTENKALIELLYSNQNLEANMDVGFKGNPNVGSVVLNQFADMKEFKHFASTFDQNDRIFIIGSIFGGTGAAGFPLLLKNLRRPDKSLNNYAWLRDSKIGAVTIHPYFGVKPDTKSKILKATFYSKTKAALKYYQNNIGKTNALNAMYYLGDIVSGEYDNHEGSKEQTNNAHFIELAAALAAIDFASQPDEKFKVEDGVAISPLYKEYGIKKDTEEIDFTTIGSRSAQLIQTPLTQYQLMINYLNQHLDEALKEKRQWTIDKGVRLNNDDFFSKEFFKDSVEPFNMSFSEWIREMANNKRAFKPFDLTVTDKNVFQLVRNIEEKKGGRTNFDYFDVALSDAADKVGDKDRNHKFMSVFYTATQEIVSKRLNFE